MRVGGLRKCHTEEDVELKGKLLEMSRFHTPLWTFQ